MGASCTDNVVWMKMKGNDIITFQLKNVHMFKRIGV